MLPEITVSITDHKQNPMATAAVGMGMAVAVLDHNEPAFYCVAAKAYEELMDVVDNLEQAVGREPDRQAVPPAADRLREVLAGVSRAILRSGLSQGAPPAVHGHP